MITCSHKVINRIQLFNNYIFIVTQNCKTGEHNGDFMITHNAPVLKLEDLSDLGYTIISGIYIFNELIYNIWTLTAFEMNDVEILF